METMRLRRWIMGVVAAGALLVGGFLVLAWRFPIPPVDPPAASGFEPALVRRGQELALLGDCRTCHTAKGGQELAGGLPMPTPFGTIYSTNITPDPATGIGSWSEAAFARAMREGVNRLGQHLYPAFPYDHFTRIGDEDLRALYAYVMTRDPVQALVPPNRLVFPVNIRLVLAGWKLLFLDQGRFVPDPSRDAAWNRGKYLVDGLGHCGGCHTPRNLMGAEEAGRALAGGQAEGWDAPALGPASPAPVPWDEAALRQYLRQGFHPLHGSARGPMAPVVRNLADAPDSDVAAIAHYLASLGSGAGGAGPGPAGPHRPVPAGDAAAPGRRAASAGLQAATPAAPDQPGAALYAAACASCHESGRELPLGAVDLGLSTALAGPGPANLVNLVLEGVPAESGQAAPVMPGFAGMLSDAQLVDLAGYLRGAFTDKPAWTGIEAVVRTARAAARPAMPTAHPAGAPR